MDGIKDLKLKINQLKEQIEILTSKIKNLKKSKKKEKYYLNRRINSTLRIYYYKNNLSSEIENFEPNKFKKYNIINFTKEDISSLIYLYNKYLKPKEIIKHIPLSLNTICTYLYLLRKENFIK